MTLTTRQKTLIPILVIAVAIIGWEAYSTYTNMYGAAKAPVLNPVEANIPTMKQANLDQSSNQMDNSNSANAVPLVANNPNANPVQYGAPQQSVPQTNQGYGQDQTVADANNPSQTLPQETRYTPAQYGYLRLVNEYQILQMQQMIAQTSQSIALARLNAAKARAELNKYYASSSINVNTIPVNSAFNNSETVPGNQGQYQLVYTGEQTGRWEATLRRGGQYLDVSIGSQIDGGTVASIDDNNVTLNNGSQKTVISFFGDSVVNTAPAVGQQAPATSQNAVAATTAAPAATTAKTNNTLIDPATASLNEGSKTAAQTTAKPAAASKTATTAANTITKSNPAIAATSANATKNNTVATAAANNAANAAKNNTATTASATNPAKPSAAVVNTASTSKPSSTSINSDRAIASSSTKGNANDAQAILALNSAGYTIQMIADKQRSAVITFMEQNNLQTSKAYIYESYRGTQPWYALIYGQYSSIHAAQLALNSLPESTQKWVPYVRRISFVQAEIKDSSKAQG